MPEWMTAMKRDKVTFIEDKVIKHNYPESSYIQNDYYEYVEKPKEDKPKIWWIVVALLLIILLKKR